MRTTLGTRRLAKVYRLVGRSGRALAVMLSMTLVAGLFTAAAPSPAKAAPIPVVVTVDPGGSTTYDPAVMAQIIQQVLNESPELGDAIKRMVSENEISVGDASTAGVNFAFHGTIAATSDNTGLTVTVDAADSPQSYQDPFWKGTLGGIVSSIVGYTARAMCQTRYNNMPGLTDEQKKLAKGWCSGIGSSIASFVYMLVIAAWDNQMPDTATVAEELGKMWASFYFGNIQWDEDNYLWLVNSVLQPLLSSAVSLATSTTWPWIQPAYTTLKAYVTNWANPQAAVWAAVSQYRRTVSASTLPCDTYSAYGAPCVDAYSTTRSLYSAFAGPLYQVQRASDGATTDIYPITTGGTADASTQNSFCAGTICTISKIYDQSPDWDDVTPGPAGGAGAADRPAYAAALPVQLGGVPVYGVDVTPGIGYRDNSADNTATDGEPEDMYMVASGTHVNSGCCFDFGNAETNSHDNGAGHMDSVNLSTACFFLPCAGSGPWVQADLENGLFMGGNGSNTSNTGNGSNFVTALVKNDGQSTFAIKGADAQGGALTSWWDGHLPTNLPNYIPMSQEGAVTLGVGGDNSNSSVGSFFEGAMTLGYPSSDADTYVQENIVQASYSGNSGGVTSPGGMVTTSGGKCLDVLGDDTGGNLANVDVWDCQPWAQDQHWTHNSNGSLETLGKCLDIIGNSTKSEAKLELWDCNGVGGQVWQEDGENALENPQSGMCLDDPGGDQSNGVQLQIYPCNENLAQVFHVTGGSPVVNYSSGKCVDVYGDDNAAAGAKVDLWDCQSYSTDQHWSWNTSTGQLESLGLCLDTTNIFPQQGDSVVMNPCSSAQSQE